MTNIESFWLITGVFYFLVLAGLVATEVHLIRIIISLRPENCEKCTGFFKEKSVHKGWRNGDEYDIFEYKYTYKVDGAEYEFHGGCRFEVKEEKQEEYKDDDYTLALNRKKAEEPDKYALPETIEVLYSVKCPKRAFSHDVDNYDNPRYDKIFIGIVAFFIVFCLAAVIYAAYILLG